MWAPEVPPGPLADRQAMVSEFAPQKIPGPHHSWVDLCGKKMLKDRKIFLSVLGLNSQPWGCEPKGILLSHSATRTHACTHTFTNGLNFFQIVIKLPQRREVLLGLVIAVGHIERGKKPLEAVEIIKRREHQTLSYFNTYQKNKTKKKQQQNITNNASISKILSSC